MIDSPTVARSTPLSLKSLIRALRRTQSLKGAVQAFRVSRDALIDRWLDVKTVERAQTTPPKGTLCADSIQYGAIDYLLLRSLVEPLRLKPDDVFVDIGCGKGRVLCLLSRRNLRKCIGIEYDDTLADLARENLQRLRGRRSPVQVISGDAAEADYSEGSVFWLYHPFGAETLEIVMRRIRDSLKSHPRRIQIVYVNCFVTRDHFSAFEQMEWLECARRIRPPLFNSIVASYFTNRTESGV